MRTKRIEFQAPPNVIPEGVSTGEDFDMVGTFRVKDNGNTLCLVQLGDTKMPGYDDSEKGQADYSGEVQAMQGQMQGGGSNYS
jgi:hypothetical protein